jgi:lipopolysaccharide/colanic/teichoic acid biosynthesis glycosyltransferase
MIIKRIFDISASFFGLLFLSPVLIVLILLIKMKMPGPVFFFQERVGQHGIPFNMVKFRTMLVNHGGNTISVKGENRITPFGSVLRKYKLDELPELWNVLKGDMSFVGPRPDVSGYADKLAGEERKILLLKPGITGPATLKYSREDELLASRPDPVKYSDEVIWPDKVSINLNYMEHRTFWLDMKIIIFTVLGKRLNT